MMRLIVNGEPYVYTHTCREGEAKGYIMSKETQRQFLIDTLYESFCRCGSNVKLLGDEHKDNNEFATSSLKQQPDIIYKMEGDNCDTWLYVMLSKDEKSLIDMKYIGKSVEKRGILPVMIVGDLWCLETNGQKNICGSVFAAKYETISLLRETNKELPALLTQKQLIEKIALSWQQLDASIIEPYLDKDFHYTADAVFYEMSSRHEYMSYIKAKYDRLRDGSNPIGIRIGRLENTNDFALLLHQGAYNQTLLVTISTREGRIISMRMSEYEV